MSDVTFTGERLHAGDTLFSVDLARHEAAYELAKRSADGACVLDLGCGTGYGSAALAASGVRVTGLDRIPPDSDCRGSGARFVRAELPDLPLAPGSFDLIVSFQVIEHLEDPTDYVDAIAGLLRPDGLALLTTPNRLTSDGVNPFHVHEYLAEELETCLSRRFGDVKMQGIGATPQIRRYMQARSQRIRRVMRLDPLGLRDRLPRPLVEWLFARFAVLVRRRTRDAGLAPEATWRDFPIGPAAPDCFDLLASCRRPR